jgi:hypothetical protein
MWQVMTMAALIALVLGGRHSPHGPWSPDDQDGILRLNVDQPEGFDPRANGTFGGQVTPE